MSPCIHWTRHESKVNFYIKRWTVNHFPQSSFSFTVFVSWFWYKHIYFWMISLSARNPFFFTTLNYLKQEWCTKNNWDLFLPPARNMGHTSLETNPSKTWDACTDWPTIKLGNADVIAHGFYSKCQKLQRLTWDHHSEGTFQNPRGWSMRQGRPNTLASANCDFTERMPPVAHHAEACKSGYLHPDHCLSAILQRSLGQMCPPLIGD